MVCLVDQKFSSIKLFAGTSYGHYTSSGTIKKLVYIMLDEVYLTLDGRMCFATNIDFAFDGNEGFYRMLKIVFSAGDLKMGENSLAIVFPGPLS